MIWPQVHPWLCCDHNSYGEVVKEACGICMDSGVSRKFWDSKGKDGFHTNIFFLDWNKEFHVHVDASLNALGVVLEQPGERDLNHLITFTSWKLSSVEKNYATIEREGLEMMYALQKFWHYLLGGHFKMFMDHSYLKYLINNLVLGGGDIPLATSLSGVLFWDNYETRSLECWPRSFIMDWDRWGTNKHWRWTARCVAIQNWDGWWLLWSNHLVFGDGNHTKGPYHKWKEAVGG